MAAVFIGILKAQGVEAHALFTQTYCVHLSPGEVAKIIEYIRNKYN